MSVPIISFVTLCVSHVFSGALNGVFHEVHIVLFDSLYIFCAIDIFVKWNVFLRIKLKFSLNSILEVDIFDKDM